VNDLEAISPRSPERALAVTDDRQLALKTATGLWAEATTASTTGRREEVIYDKVAAVRDFFDFTGKSPAEVAPGDVRAWRVHLESMKSKEGKQLQPATVYARISRLSSFYTWLMSDPQLAGEIIANPVLLARPKAPRAYQGESTKALTDEKVQALGPSSSQRLTWAASRPSETTHSFSSTW
jgi:hypothetical protein